MLPRRAPATQDKPDAAQAPPDLQEFHEAGRFRAAAYRATQLYPGPVGDLLARELRAQADFGYRVGASSVVARAATAILATPLSTTRPATAAAPAPVRT